MEDMVEADGLSTVGFCSGFEGRRDLRSMEER
jgi:hypothetical protein